METNEIKKVLYKEKVDAIFKGYTATKAIYEATTSLGIHTFKIPPFEYTEDMKEGKNIKASLLIRWLKN